MTDTVGRPVVRRARVRWTKNERRGEWAFGIGRSIWPRPHPHGMALYVLHVLWWNLIVERDL